VRAALVPFCLMVGLGGCQSAPTYSGGSSERTAVLHPGDAAVSVVGTPFYLAFKGVTCAMSAVIAAPVAGVTALSESRFAPEIRESLGDGLTQNCGPPYALSPYRLVSVERAPPVPRAPAPGKPSGPPSGASRLPSPLRPVEPALGPPPIPPPAHPPEPPVDHSGASSTDAFAERAAGRPIKLFKE
jgi:hypothetical protein